MDDMNTEALAKQKCVPCEGGTLPMPIAAARKYLPMVHGWSLSKTKDRKDVIITELKFKDFKKALSFINAVGRIAEHEGHHPNIQLYSWNRVRLELYTHAIGGLSQNDFIVAAKINKSLLDR